MSSTLHTRPVNQLDAALKQFTLSTAASRENLRNSRVDLGQLEEQVTGSSDFEEQKMYLAVKSVLFDLTAM